MEARLAEKFETVDRQFDRIDQRFDEINQRFEGVYSRLEDVQTAIDSTRTWTIAALITFAAVMLGTMARGFGWI